MITTQRLSLVIAGLCDLCNEDISGESDVLGVLGYDLMLETTCIHGDKTVNIMPGPFLYCSRCETGMTGFSIKDIINQHRLVMLPLLMQIPTTASYQISLRVDGALYKE